MRESLKDSLGWRRVRKRLLQKRWQRIVSVLGCVVVFCVTYALILPAITLTNKTPICGMEEHTHTDDCYEQVLVCGLEESEGHTHTDACYDEEGNLICGLEESEGHVHDESCYEQRLTCELEEHTHTDACYPVEEVDQQEPEAPGAPAVTLEEKTDAAQVTVEAPEGALPEGTTIKLEDKKPEDYLDAVREVTRLDELTADDVMAVDISFLDANGAEIQPADNVTVKLTRRGDDTTITKDADIVHIKDDGTGELVKSEVDQHLLTSDEVSFTSGKFSVYVVVDPPSTDDEARATVNFYGKDTTTPVATVYVKNSDTAAELEEILYDPGVGTLEEGELFRGWSVSSVGTTDGENYTTTTTPQTIEDVRTLLEAANITEGDVYNIYGMVFKAYSVQFKDESGVTIHSETLTNRTGEDIAYTINQQYTPKSQDAAFEGWNVTTGSDKIDPTPSEMTDGLYPLGTTVTISGNVIFSANPAPGYWLSFDENGDGVSYTPPQFIKQGNTPVEPDDPERLGYTFGGWYTDEACTAGNEFDFTQELTQRTTVYAKWMPVTTANYTVIVWQESMSDTYDDNAGSGTRNYDFYQSYTLTGTVGSTINAVSNSNVSVTDADGSYYNVRVRGTDTDGNTVNDTIAITGYHAASYDTGVTIAPEGTSVVNVYYDRNAVTYTFYTVEYTRTNNNQGTQYGIVNGEYVQLTRINRNWYSYVPTTSNYGTQYGYYDGQYVQLIYDYFYNYGYAWAIQINGQYYIWDGARYALQNYYGNRYTAAWTNVYQDEKGLYGETLNWPTDNSYWWYESYSGNQGSGTRMTYKSAFLPLDDDMTVVYYGSQQTANGAITFYTQDVSGGDSYTAQYSVATTGGSFSINDKFTGFYAYQYRIDGGDWQNVGTLNPSTGIYGSAVSYENSLDIRYNRITGTITFMDGAYFNGNGINMNETRKADAFAQSDSYYYQADISSYNKGGANYYTPEAFHDGYTFAGWFADDACTQEYNFSTMPATGVTAYAKWVKTQYRVLMHPNVDASDTSLDWGNQEMSFRVDYGEKIADGNAIIGTRDDYEIIGWYTDEACTQPFNFDAFTLNDTTVTTEYDQTESTELDKYGNVDTTQHPADYNADAANNRTWIDRKLDLYAKWRAKLEGAKGINVVYEADGKGVDTAGHETDITGTNAPTDTLSYLDNSEAVAGAASTPTDSDTYQFLYWVVQTWDDSANDGEGGYVDTDTHVYPGDSFTVLKANARRTDNPDTTGEDDRYLYMVQLRAQYGPKTEPTPTHLTWYDNYTTSPTEGNGLVTDNGDGGDGLQINEAVDIRPASTFTRDGYTFIGWARVPNADNSTPSQQDLTEDDLFLKYDAAENKFYADLDGDGTYETEAEQVAADEKSPYHDMYAVWEKTPVVKIIKVDKDSNNAPLSNAVFTMKQGETTLYSSLTSGADGYLATGGASSTTQFTLAEGSYTLSETLPPAGYNAATGNVTITVNDSSVAAANRVTYIQADDNSGSSQTADYDATTETYTVTITNSAGATLPSAGALGPVLFTIFGAALAAFSVTMTRLSGKSRWAEAFRAWTRGGDASR